jgi:lysylphosphatidylglycerol synthetase-like protein (DUF2156 family)
VHTLILAADVEVVLTTRTFALIFLTATLNVRVSSAYFNSLIMLRLNDFLSFIKRAAASEESTFLLAASVHVLRITARPFGLWLTGR